MRNLNIDHIDALSMLEEAYDLLAEFERVIDNQLEGDHPCARQVNAWCSLYEKIGGME